MGALQLECTVHCAYSLINQDISTWVHSKRQDSVLIFFCFLAFRGRWSQPVQMTHYICGIFVRGGRLSCIHSNSTERGKHTFHDIKHTHTFPTLPWEKMFMSVLRQSILIYSGSLTSGHYIYSASVIFNSLTQLQF